MSVEAERGGGYDKIFSRFYGRVLHSLSSLGVCTQIWILWEPPLDRPNDCLSAISKPSAFLSRQTQCSAKRGQVQLCLIALFDTHTHTHTSIHWTHTRTHRRTRQSAVAAISPARAKLNSTLLPPEPNYRAPFLFAFPSFEIIFMEVITLVFPESQTDAKQAACPILENIRKGCAGFRGKKNKPSYHKLPGCFSNQSSKLI